MGRGKAVGPLRLAVRWLQDAQTHSLCSGSRFPVPHSDAGTLEHPLALQMHCGPEACSAPGERRARGDSCSRDAGWHQIEVNR